MGEIRTEQLRPHPLNVKLYGKETHADLLESIAKLGILEPIVYSRMSVNGGDAHYYILSGTRRWMAAKEMKLCEVPAREAHVDGLDAERFLIEANRQRVKTKVQRLQEYKRLKEIETALAKERQREHANTAPGKKSLAASLPQVNGEAREKAAETVGLKPRTAEKGLAVLNRAEAGDPKAKAALESIGREEMSVDRAYREVTGIIEANRQRVKTKVQRLQEYKRLKEIETVLAKEREREAGRNKGRANLPDAGRAREKAAKGKNWSTANLRSSLVGHKIMVVGWMMLDKEHCNASENTNPGGAHNWGATCWEIHPISALGPAQ